jgi:hypothetical protein
MRMLGVSHPVCGPHDVLICFVVRMSIVIKLTPAHGDVDVCISNIQGVLRIVEFYFSVVSVNYILPHSPWFGSVFVWMLWVNSTGLVCDI